MPRTRELVPAPVRAALEQVFGEPVDDVELVEHSWYARLYRGARATTRRNRILLPGSVAEFLADPDLVLHEYYHVLRQWNRGRLSLLRYLGELSGAARTRPRRGATAAPRPVQCRPGRHTPCSARTSTT